VGAFKCTDPDDINKHVIRGQKNLYESCLTDIDSKTKNDLYACTASHELLLEYCYCVFPSTETLLQAKAWEATTPIVKEMVQLLLNGNDLSDLPGNTTFKAADAITLRRLSTAGQTLIAKKVVPQEKDAKPRNILRIIETVEEAARDGLKSGHHRVKTGSLTDFLASPMRAKMLKIETPESATKKREKAANKSLPVPRTEEDAGESKGKCLYDDETALPR